jgi:hypothetical protein
LRRRTVLVRHLDHARRGSGQLAAWAKNTATGNSRRREAMSAIMSR